MTCQVFKLRDCKHLIKEADVLLFKAGGFPSVGWWIGKYTRSPYSHAGLAHWDNGLLYCLEFREFKGSRQYSMDKYVTEKGSIDVFRPACLISYPHLKVDSHDSQPYMSCERLEFTTDVANNVTGTALDLVGKPYSYWNIWQMFKTYIPFVRLRTRALKNGEPDPKKFVCSTLVTYAYRKNFIDPIPFLCDQYTSPGDLARSGLFSYLFTINN